MYEACKATRGTGMLGKPGGLRVQPVIVKGGENGVTRCQRESQLALGRRSSVCLASLAAS